MFFVVKVKNRLGINHYQLKIMITIYDLQEISTELNAVISKMVEVKEPESEEGQNKIKKLVQRDLTGVRSNVDRQLKKCQEQPGCSGGCDR